MKNYKVIAMTGYDEQDKKNVSSKDAFVLDCGDGDFALVAPSIGHVKMSFTPDSFFKWDDFIDISDNEISEHGNRKKSEAEKKPEPSAKVNNMFGTVKKN